MSRCFGLTYNGLDLLDCIDRHPVFHEGAKVYAPDNLWAEFQSCLKLGLDPDIYFQKDRFSRILITGGVIADGAINSMRQWDAAKEREHEMKMQGRKK